MVNILGIAAGYPPVHLPSLEIVTFNMFLISQEKGGLEGNILTEALKRSGLAAEKVCEKPFSLVCAGTIQVTK